MLSIGSNFRPGTIQDEVADELFSSSIRGLGASTISLLDDSFTVSSDAGRGLVGSMSLTSIEP
jgi:hypothetical protein